MSYFLFIQAVYICLDSLYFFERFHGLFPDSVIFFNLKLCMKKIYLCKIASKDVIFSIKKQIEVLSFVDMCYPSFVLQKCRIEFNRDSVDMHMFKKIEEIFKNNGCFLSHVETSIPPRMPERLIGDNEVAYTAKLTALAIEADMMLEEVKEVKMIP